MVRARVRNRVGKGFLSKDKGMIRNDSKTVMIKTSITSHCIENTIPTKPMIKHRNDFYDWKLQIYTLFWYSIYIFTEKNCSRWNENLATETPLQNIERHRTWPATFTIGRIRPYEGERKIKCLARWRVTYLVVELLVRNGMSVRKDHYFFRDRHPPRKKLVASSLPLVSSTI